jgi:alkyl hydroperoxide reductase subunit AhpC
LTTKGEIDFHQFIGDSWTILFSHPADFTPVCTTELGAFAKMKDEFEKRGVKMIGLVGFHNRHSALKRASFANTALTSERQRHWFSWRMDQGYQRSCLD